MPAGKEQKKNNIVELQLNSSETLARRHEIRWRNRSGDQITKDQAFEDLADRIDQIARHIEQGGSLDKAVNALCEVSGYCRSQSRTS